MIAKPDRGQPRAMLARPRLTGTLPIDLTAQQEVPDPVPGANQVHADVLPAADQIAQLLTLHRRDRDQHKLTRRQQPGQADRVALISLDPVRRTLGLARRAHPELDPLRQRPARQPIARRAGLIDHPRRPLHRAQPRQQLMRATDHPPRGHLTRGLIKHSKRRLTRVHVQTDPTDTVRHIGTSCVVGPASKLEPSTRTSPPRPGVPTSFDLQPAGPPYRLYGWRGSTPSQRVLCAIESFGLNCRQQIAVWACGTWQTAHT